MRIFDQLFFLEIKRPTSRDFFSTYLLVSMPLNLDLSRRILSPQSFNAPFMLTSLGFPLEVPSKFILIIVVRGGDQDSR
jgi:hypothetical protein